MSYHLLVRPEFELTFNQNLDYLSGEWNNKVIEEFIDRVENVVQKITLNPFLFPLHGYGNNVRKAVINKRIILYYRIIDGDTIELLTIWNAYGNPQNLKF